MKKKPFVHFSHSEQAQSQGCLSILMEFVLLGQFTELSADSLGSLSVLLGFFSNCFPFLFVIHF